MLPTENLLPYFSSWFQTAFCERPNPQSDTRMRSTPGGFQWGTRSQFHTQQLTPFSRSRYYQLQFLKSSLQSNRHQTAESLANPESCKFNELLLSTLKVFPYFTIVIDTSGAEADGYFSTMYFCNESPGANSKTAVRESRVAQRKRAGPRGRWIETILC